LGGTSHGKGALYRSLFRREGNVDFWLCVVHKKQERIKAYGALSVVREEPHDGRAVRKLFGVKAKVERRLRRLLFLL
jgi:hypothetical protein